jgi:hypothetical protein
MRIFLILFALSGCAYKPVVDLRASEEKAQLFQRDSMECRRIIKENIPWYYDRSSALEKCLEGRGHSVLNSYK